MMRVAGHHHPLRRRVYHATDAHMGDCDAHQVFQRHRVDHQGHLFIGL